MKYLTIAAVAAFAFASPVLAQDAMKPAANAMATMAPCDDASLTKLGNAIDAMAGAAANKQEASKELAMAKDAMGMKQADVCAVHMDNAMKAMGHM